MSAQAIALKLGGPKVIGRRIRTEADLIEAVREGLPSRSLDFLAGYLADQSITKAALFRILGSARTLQRKRTDNARLSFHVSDRLARVARLLVRTEEAIGDASRGRRWLAQPNRALGGERPLDLLDSDAGTHAVEQILGRIEHGVYS
jgi:putative toxin-antitoxin system antitoxin component (TIGR02293 family)